MDSQKYNPQAEADIKLRSDSIISNLERVRISRGMTQAQLAEKSGISIHTIRGFERLSRNINGTDIERLLDFCIALDCQLEDIIEGADAIEKAKAIRATEPQNSPPPAQFSYSYPQNLLRDIFEDIDAAQNCVDSETTLEYLYRLLPENWGDILKLRYRDKYTLEQIGNRYQVTRARIGQIIRFAIEKLNTTDHITCLQLGIDAYKAHCEQIEQEKANRKLSDISIEELKLSGRAYNALMRAGYDTIEKASKLDFADLTALKNMNESAANEVLVKIKPYTSKDNPASIELKKIYEHDVDLLIMEEFISDQSFAHLFLGKLQLPDNYTICRASHSLADSDGESDLTLVLQYPEKKIALLIEDKIDAQTMPEQSERYHKRAQKAVSRGEYDAYYIMLAAPADYHREHKNDSNAAYEYRICYEELRDYFAQQNNSRAAFKAAVIDCALKEKKTGYQVQEIPAATEFWMRLRNFCKENYPQLSMVGSDTPKGAAARWPEFRTTLGAIRVIYKSQKGFVDLEFPQYGERIADLHAIIGDRIAVPMQIWKTGKSASVRLSDEKWILDFTQDFDTCQAAVSDVLQAVATLCEFASTLNYSELY